MPAKLVPNIKALRVNPGKPFHSGYQIGLRGFNDQMKMVAHQAVRMHLPFSLCTSFSERAKKPLPVLVILKNVLALVAAIEHMINCAGILDA